MTYISRKMCAKNENGKHYGQVTCEVCGEQYDWIEDTNADIEVKSVDLDGKETFLNLKVTAKCPHCNYKFSYPQSINGNKFR